MGMTTYGWETRRSILGFIASLLLAWLFVHALLGNQATLSAPSLSWALASATLGWAILSWIEYFKLWRPFPRRSDILIFAMAFLPPALLSKYLTRLASGVDVLRYRDILCGFPLPVLVAYSCQWLSGWSALTTRKKRGILLVLLPEERAEVIRALKVLRLHQRFEYLDYSSLSSFKSPIQLVVISRGATRAFDAHSSVIEAHLAGISVVDIRQLLSDLTRRINVERTDAWSFLFGATRHTVLLRAYHQLKLVAEPVLASFLLMALAPLAVLTAIAIRLDSRGPILYWQNRVGHRGKRFQMVKFRSMRVDAESSVPVWSYRQDRRVTAVGAFLRASRIDELPQLWNIARGQMGFIGPRPERPEFYELLRERIPLFSLRTRVRPGLTGWAQVHSGYAGSIEQSRLKLEYDLYYIQHLSVRLDLIIFVKTLGVLFMGDRQAPLSETDEVSNETLASVPSYDDRGDAVHAEGGPR